MTTRTTRVAIADDHQLARSGIRRFMEHTGDLRLVAEAATAAGALDVVQSHALDVLVLDQRMPDGSGLDAMPKILAAAPHLQVIVLSAIPEDLLRPAAMNAGAFECLDKSAAPERILDTIRAAGMAAAQ